MFNSYRQALDFLYRRNEFAIKLGLENIQKFFSLPGNKKLTCQLIHVAGTNGKGSVCHYLGHWLPQLGYKRVGVFTSPHLVSFRERIQVNQQPIPPEDVRLWMGAHQRNIEELGLTYFECVTAMAVDYFLKQNCDVVVLETGLGGRLDATNIFTPTLSVITSISLDHTAILGDSLVKIAEEKMGILKPSVPAVVYMEEPELRERLMESSSNLGCDVLNLAESQWCRRLVEGGGAEFQCKYSDYKLSVPTGTPSEYLTNIHLALQSLEIFTSGALDYFKRSRTLVPNYWARQQEVQEPGLPLLLLDVSHNPAGVQSLRKVLDERGEFPLTLIFSAMGDKDVSGMLVEIQKIRAENYFFVELSEIPRGLKWEVFKKTPHFSDSPWKLWNPTPSNLEALLRTQKGWIGVFGSFYLLGKMLPLFAEYYTKLAYFKDLAIQDTQEKS